MSSSIRLTQSSFSIEADSKVVRAEQYTDYLDAKSLLEQAQQQKQTIIDNAKSLCELEKQRGYQQGTKQSQQEHIKHWIKTVHHTINYINSIEQTLVELVVDATRQIIGQFDDIEMTVAVVKKALNLVSKEKQITIYVSPSEIDVLQSRVHEILKEHPGISFIEFQPASHLKQGSCLLESPMGVIDASIDVQLNALKAALQQKF